MPVGAILGGTAISSMFGMVGADKQARAQRQGQALQTQTVTQQLAYEREQDERNRRDALRIEAEERRQWDAEQAQAAEDRALERQRYGETTAESRRRDELNRAEDLRDFVEDRNRYQARETRLQPYRNVGATAIGRLNDVASQAGVQLRPVGQMTQGLPGAPGAPPASYPAPPMPPPPSMGALAPPR